MKYAKRHNPRLSKQPVLNDSTNNRTVRTTGAALLAFASTGTAVAQELVARPDSYSLPFSSAPVTLDVLSNDTPAIAGDTLTIVDLGCEGTSCATPLGARVDVAPAGAGVRYSMPARFIGDLGDPYPASRIDFHM